MKKNADRGFYWLVGAILLLIAGFATYMIARDLTSQASVPGQVMDVVERTVTDEGTGEAQTLLFPVIVFTTQAGTKQVVELDQGEVESSYEMGDEITVYYDRRDPQIASLQGVGGDLPILWMLSAGIALVGLVFVGLQLK
jgi:hypothetical protein